VERTWYLVKTKPQNEHRVDARLTGAGYETLFPKIRKRNRRTKVIETRPLFPTYLFVRFPYEHTKTIRYTHGVARVVSFGADPQEVGEEIIEAVRARMDGEGIVTLLRRPVEWTPGQRVRIGEGPLEGLDAIFLEEIPDRDRVVLLLDAVSAYKVTVPKDQIER